jgi:hypothetical protein
MGAVVKTPSKRVITKLVSGGLLTTPNNSVLVVGLRGIEGEPSVVMPQLQPQAGYPSIGLFKPYPLPMFTSGNAALSWMQSCGFTVNFGVQFTISLPAPNAAVLSNGVYTLTWNVQPYGFDQLLGIPLTGSVKQNTSVGTLSTATVYNNKCTMTIDVSSGVTFSTTAPLTVVYINSATAYPDPHRTEQICMQLYHLFETLNSAPTQLTSPAVAFPNVYISVLTQQDAGYAPSSTPIALPAPHSATKSNGMTTLLWNSVSPSVDTAILEAFGRLPDGQLGNTLVDQATSLGKGVFYQKLTPGYATGAIAGMIVQDVSGTFNATNTISVVLDATQSVFELMQGTYLPYVAGWHEDTTANLATYTLQFTNGINALNETNSIAQNGGGRTFGFLSNTTINKNLVNTLPTNYHNTMNMIWGWYPYLTTMQDIPVTACDVTACLCAIGASNGAPFNPMNRIVMPSLPTPLETSQDISVSPQGQSETALQLGYTPVFVNSNGQAATVRMVTGELTMPNTTQVDNEFFPLSTWQIISAYGQDLISYFSGPQFTNTRKRADVGNSIVAGAVSIAKQYQQQGMFENVNQYVSQFVLQNDPVDPAKWILQAPAQIIPEFNALDIDVNILSSLLSFSVSL